MENNRYYTNDHEWINFGAAVAYAGVCLLKLTGFREIQSITFHKATGFINRGEPIASIKYNDYVIQMHMPVDGTIMQINKELLSGNLQILLQYPESKGWIAMLLPSQADDRRRLLLAKEYRFHRENTGAER